MCDIIVFGNLRFRPSTFKRIDIVFKNLHSGERFEKMRFGERFHRIRVDGRQNKSGCVRVLTGPQSAFRACLHGGGGPQVGGVTCGGSPHLSCKRDQIKMRNYVDRRVTHQSGLPHPPGVPHLHVNRPLVNPRNR